MPCGGIYPLSDDSGECFHCGKEGAKHFCEEWDCFIHAICVLDFLKDKEGQIVIHHGHQVVLNFGCEDNANHNALR